MGYAITKDGNGWRAVDSPSDIDPATETFQDTKPAPITPSAHAALIESAQAELDVITGTRGTIIRCAAAGVAVPAAWSAHVTALRAIVNGTDTISTTLPMQPAYPAGT